MDKLIQFRLMLTNFKRLQNINCQKSTRFNVIPALSRAGRSIQVSNSERNNVLSLLLLRKV